jgi:CO/xanthine dehydrogenase FAD-binding subunit
MNTQSIEDSAYNSVTRSIESAHFSLGAGATLEVVYEDPDIPVVLKLPLRGWYSWQQRNTTTVKQAVLSPSLAPQWIAALLAWGAEVSYAGIEGGSLLANFIERSEPKRGKVASLRLSIGPEGRVWGEAHVGRTPVDQPIVFTVAVLDLKGSMVQDARLALTGVWPENVCLVKAATALVGAQLNDEAIEGVVSAVGEEVNPPSDFLGNSEYRRKMAGVLSRRALQACKEKAKAYG